MKKKMNRDQILMLIGAGVTAIVITILCIFVKVSDKRNYEISFSINFPAQPKPYHLNKLSYWIGQGMLKVNDSVRLALVVPRESNRHSGNPEWKIIKIRNISLPCDQVIINSYQCKVLAVEEVQQNSTF